MRTLKGFTERVKAKELYSPSLKYPELWTPHKSMLTQDFWFDLDRHRGSDFYPDSEPPPKLGKLWMQAYTENQLTVKQFSQTFPVLSSAKHKSPSHNQYPSLFLLPTSSKGSSGKIPACHPICSSSYCFLNHSSKQATNRRMSYNTSSSTLSQAFHNSQDKLGWHYYFYYCYCCLICGSKIRKVAQ